MKNIKLFIIGAIFITAVPIIEGIIDLVLSWIEVAKLSPTKKVLKGNNEILELQTQLEKVDNAQCMGFEYNPQEELIYEDEFEEEDKNKDKVKLGFH
jgi:hypothetical protein